jgi:hypothetical protein
MAQRIDTHQPTPAEVRREDWLRDGVLSGFIATFAMTVVLAVGYGLAKAIGKAEGGRVARWFWALEHNPVAARTTDGVVAAIALNLLMGLVLALVYGRWVEPSLTGPGWRKGVVFALVPWLLSVVAVLPFLGGGFLGANIGAGPLPILGNLVLHIVYGAVLGSVYAIALETGLDDSPAERANAAPAERGMAIGIVTGIVLGLIIGWALAPQLDAQGSRAAVMLAGAFVGGASGLLAGSFLGMGGSQNAR